MGTVADNSRVGWALLGSMLLHLAVLFLLTAHVWRVHRVVPHEVPLQLHGRIVAASAVPEHRAPEVLRDPAAKPLVVERQPVVEIQTPQTVPHEASVAVEEDIAKPVSPETGGETEVRFGVSVGETLFQRPLPRAFEVNVKKNPGFIRSTDLHERPEPIELVVPDIASNALSRRITGSVTMALFIDESGQVVDAARVAASEDFEDFEAEIIQALKQSTFTPGKMDGRSVKSLSFQVIRFGPLAVPLRAPESAVADK
jgi:hypothetical protein